MHWIILILAGLCEVAFAYCLGRAKGITVVFPYYAYLTDFRTKNHFVTCNSEKCAANGSN